MAELPTTSVGVGDSVNNRGSQVPSLDSGSSAWLFEQTQKLEKQQQLQQQRLFELQQVSVCGCVCVGVCVCVCACVCELCCLCEELECE